MKVIRSKVFETNSSSTHSICICEDAALNDTISHNGTITLEGGEFGWEVATYKDAMTKANYLVEYIHNWEDDDRAEEWRTILKESIQEQTGANVILNPKGYIDHQSVESHQYDDIFRSKETVKQFIFSKESILHTDNDNH